MTRSHWRLLASLAALALGGCERSSDAAEEDAAAPAPDAHVEPWAPPEQCADVTSFVGGEPGAADGVVVSGHAFAFTLSGGRIEGAFVTANEHPTWCARTDAEGTFQLEGVPVGSDITLRLHHAEHPLIQTGTHTVPAEGIERLTFQAPDHATYSLMAAATRIRTDPTRCQIAATVTEVGRSLYTTDWPSHGEAGATVTIAPALVEPAFGPIYFEYLGPGAIIPDPRLTETTRDGGVLFLNVPAGDYVLSAHEEGVAFTDVRVHCEAGLLVNPSPPWSLQALGGEDP